MIKQDILLILKAFYKVNAVIRASYDAHHAFKYAQTDEYLDRILEQYNNLKKEEKVMESPEKIYLQPLENDEIYNHWYRSKLSNDFVEYTRTDAFIEKACSGIEKLLSGYIIRNFHFGDSYDTDKLIEDFKNYMKGE